MLLAAGSGMRLRPLTEHVPKVMLPLGDKPLLEHTLEHLVALGVREFVINLSYQPEAVRSYFGDGRAWGARIQYSLEPQALGTAGGVKNVQSFFRGQPFLLWYGDNLSRCDVARMAAQHRAQGAMLTLALWPREDVGASGIVGIAEDGRIQRFLEKPRPEQVFSHWVNAGIMLVEPAVLDAIPAGQPSDFSHEILPALLVRGERLYGYRLSAQEGLWWIDTPADLARVQEEWRAVAPEGRRSP